MNMQNYDLDFNEAWDILNEDMFFDATDELTDFGIENIDVTYDDVRKILDLNLKFNDEKNDNRRKANWRRLKFYNNTLKKIEETIDSKNYYKDIHGLRRICYFYNAHMLETTLLASEKFKELVAETLLNFIKHNIPEHLIDKLNSSDIANCLLIEPGDNTHKTFHKFNGTPIPDFKYSVSLKNIDEMLEFFLSKTLEVKIKYEASSPYIELSANTNTYDADYTFVYYWKLGQIFVYDKDKILLDPQEFKLDAIDTSQLIDPDNFSSSWDNMYDETNCKIILPNKSK